MHSQRQLHGWKAKWNSIHKHEWWYCQYWFSSWTVGSYWKYTSAFDAKIPTMNLKLSHVLARRIIRISAAKVICIHNKLIKSQSSHKATHFRGQLFQLPDIFRFFDFPFGRSHMALVLFSFNRDAAFFTNVSLAKSVSAMWFKDRLRFLYIITLHLSEMAN